MKRKKLPLDTWMVVEPTANDEVKVLSTHATQGEAEAERDKRNRGLPSSRYDACIAFEPVAERMGRSA